MITLAEIQRKAERSYQPFLQSWLREEAYLPLRLPIGKLPDDFPQLRAAVQQLQGTAKAQRGYGYHIEMRQRQMRVLGRQTLPIAVVFETSEDFLRWLCDSPIIYWVDLDAQGFQILSLLRSAFPHVISLMMDEQTFQTFAPFHVEGTPCNIRQLPHLTPEEHMHFLYLSDRTLRLEQERISHAYALECIQRCFLHTSLH